MNASNLTSKSPILLPVTILLISFLCTYFLLRSPNKEFDLDNLVKFSVQPKENTIHASSKTTSMVVSLETQDFKVPSRTPIDLVCVIDFPGAREEWPFGVIQSSLRKVLSLMNDQDRLSIVIFDERSPSELTFFPLTNATQQNKETTFLTNGSSLQTANNNSLSYGSLRTAIQVLNQREAANPTTGIILFSYYWNRDEIDEVFQSLTSKNGSHSFLYNYPAELKEWNIFADPNDKSFHYPDFRLLQKAFEESLLELQTSLFGNLELLIKFETMARLENEVLFINRSLNLLPEKETKFVLDNIRVPKVVHPFWKSSMEVKIASCELVFAPLDGRKVVKSADLTVNIVKDETEIDKDSPEFFKYVFAVEATFHQMPERKTFYKGRDGAVKVLQRDVELL